MKKVKIIQLPKYEDPRGNLSFIEECNQIPFNIERAYWIYDVPGGQIRGGHAFHVQEEFIVALSGSFEIAIDNGQEKEIYFLNRSYYWVYIPSGFWRQIQNFSTNSLALVISSTKYNPNDYIYDYNTFLKIRNG